MEKCTYIQLFGIWHNKADSEHFAAVSVYTDVIHKRSELQSGLHFTKRYVFSSLKLNQILLTICEGMKRILSTESEN